MSDAIPRSISVTDDCSVESEISRRTEMRIARARRSSRAKARNSTNATNNGVPRAIGRDNDEPGVAAADAADEAYVQYRREKERRDEMNDRKTREKRKSRIKKESSTSKLQQSVDNSNTSKSEGRNTPHSETLRRSKPSDAKKKTRTTHLQPESSTVKAKNRSMRSEDGDDDEPSKGSNEKTKSRSKEENDALNDSLDILVAELEASTKDQKGKTKAHSKRVATSHDHTDNVAAQSDEPSKGSKGSKRKGRRRPKRVGHSSEVGDNDFASNADGSKGSTSSKGKTKSRPKRTGGTKHVDDAPAHSHDDHIVDKIVEVRIQTEHTIETFSLQKSLFTKREKEMKSIAKANKIPESRWDGSLLFCRLNEEIWSKRANKSSGSTSSMSDNVEVVNLDPPDDIQKMWSSSVYSLLVEFYESGNVKIADDMSGKEALMVLEYFGIIYAPDKVVFSTFASYMRLKMWSDYFSYREDMANYIIQKCVTKSKLSHSFFTSVEPVDSTSGQYFYVRGKKSELFDGGLKLGDPSELSCSVVHDLFNDDEGDDDERDNTFAALVQEDFCTYLKKSLPGTSIFFETCDVTTNSLGTQSRSDVGSRVVLFIKCCSEKKPKASPKPLPISFPDPSTTTSASEEPTVAANVDEDAHKSANNSIASSPENRSASPSDVIEGTETSGDSPETPPKEDKNRALNSWVVDENADNPLGALAGLLSHFDGFKYDNSASGEHGAEGMPEISETQSDSGSNGSGTKAPESSQNQVVTPERLEESSANTDECPDKLFRINEGSGDVTPRVNRLSVKPFTESSQLVPSSPPPMTTKDPITILDSMSPQTRSVIQSQIPERENIEDFNSGWLRDVFSLGFLSKDKNTQREPNLVNENMHPPISDRSLPSSLSPPLKVKRASSPPRKQPYRLVSPSTYGSSTTDASDIGDECGIEVRPRNFPKPRPPLHKRAASSS